MGTQVLAGSKGCYYDPSKKFLKNTSFIVSEDTCLETAKLPVKFVSDEGFVAAVGCIIPMEKATFASDAKYRDY